MNTKAKRGTGARRPPDDPEQAQRFKDAAVELDADESGEAFTRALDVSVKPAKSIAPPAQDSVTLVRPKRAKVK